MSKVEHVLAQSLMSGSLALLPDIALLMSLSLCLIIFLLGSGDTKQL